ncbi:MAG: protein translocase subunit SecD, partial [Nostocoides sp.]
GTQSGSAGPTAAPTSTTDLNWVTPELAAAYEKLDCSDPTALESIIDDPAKPLVTCDPEGTQKFLLGPVAVGGSDISDATAGFQIGQNGVPTSIVEIQLTFDSDAAKTYGDLSIEMLNLPSPRNQLASTLDSRVIVAPSFNEAIPGGQASITGGFGFEEAQDLAKQLKFGALPISFDLQTRTQISPTLGEEQLRLGLIAGLVGLLLVVGYSLLQYRALGLVTVASIVVAAVLTYLVITLLGWTQNYRLDMAGVTGLIVAIGVTADSFIVYFERIRDELRDGRTLRTAVETGWRRARRTILVADGVNFLGALVLYLLASSSVRGFAFTLGLTTLIDVFVVYFFTHPLVALLSRRKFFADGHPWSGVDPNRLGTAGRYVGRGRFAPARPATSSPASSSAQGSRA